LNYLVNDKPTGGGFLQSDLDTYFKSLGIPVPKVTIVKVDNGDNLPGPAPGTDGEITMDIEVAGAAAPGASLVVYFAPNTDQGFIDAVNAALHDSVNKPAVLSISWGAAENSDPSLAQGLHNALADGPYLGVTVCVATGDLGSADQFPPEMDGEPHVDSPSSSPFALACGGTKLTVSGQTIVSESAWNDGVRNPRGVGAGGGGFSALFDRPSYQDGLNLAKTGRGTPDISGHASTAEGYQLEFQGKKVVMGGTSAVAPLMAGLFARINEHLTQSGLPVAGFVNPLLYQSATAFRDITTGNNDLTGQLSVYYAGPGWDACTGLGVPDGEKLFNALTAK
jgi:kumamolisin